jgi:peptidoglycan/xylan/chitin deacetylase (PgdA/CDA1 family)
MTGSFPILTFHALDDRSSVISFPPRLFERGMRSLHDSGYRTLNLAELIEYLQRGVPFPQRSFALTFDDGYQSVYDHAFPILQRYGFSATVFLTVGDNGKRAESERLPFMCERSMLSWREIKEMHGCGITFGAHTLTHPDLTSLPSARVKIEVYDSKAIIEDALGIQVTCFAYPYGRYGNRTREIVRQHFACACSDKLDLVNGSSDLFALERVDAYYLRTERSFNVMSTRFFPWYIRARSLPRQIRRSITSLRDDRSAPFTSV